MIIKTNYSFTAYFFILLLTAISLVGCGSGGGSGYEPPPPEMAPNTHGLKNPANIYKYDSSAVYVQLDVPTTDDKEQFALVVSNIGRVTQPVSIKPVSFFGESYAASSRPALRTSGSSYYDDFMQVQQNMEGIKQRLRQQETLRLKTGKASMRSSLRASDNSAEKVDDLVDLWILADSNGHTYATRTFKLEKISATGKLKIFVDQNPYGEYSAVSGVYAVSAADIDHFAEEFEEYIYPLLSQSYGEVYDIDNDGALSLMISPAYAAFGYAGLFNSKHMSPTTTDTQNNKRDMIAVWSPNNRLGGGWVGDKWLSATRETIAHEMQHAVNYSAKFYPDGVVKSGASMEEVWLDEALSVAVEARYRGLRNAAGENDTLLEDRFVHWAENPSNVGVTEFTQWGYGAGNVFELYGIVGMFNYYLWDQGGDAAIKALVRNSKRGVANVDEVFATRGGMNGIFTDWAMAVFIEGLRTYDLVDHSKIDSKYRYNHGKFDLPLAYKDINFGETTGETTIKPYGSAFYLLHQPEDFKSLHGEYYRFTVQSHSGSPVAIRIIKLPPITKPVVSTR